jgi:hypothetical protein
MNTPVVMGLEVLASRGIIVTTGATGRLQDQPASRLTGADRDWLRERVGEIAAHLAAQNSGAEPGGQAAATEATERPLLSGSEPWNLRKAIRLTTTADELPGKLGVSGTHPGVAAAAARVVSAFASRDRETVRYAGAEFEVAVRAAAQEAARKPALPRADDAGGPSPC